MGYEAKLDQSNNIVNVFVPPVDLSVHLDASEDAMPQSLGGSRATENRQQEVDAREEATHD